MWESSIKIVDNCDLVNDEFEIFIAPKAKIKIDLLMSLFPSTEWLAYLIGNDNLIEDIIIPEQEVTATTITVIEFPKDIKTIGVIHSHHEMGSFFSGTDNDYINSNHDISICISHKEINGVSRIKTPCGALKIVPLIIRFNNNIKLDVEEFLNEVDENVILDEYEFEDEDDFGIDIDEDIEEVGNDTEHGFGSDFDEDIENMKMNIKRNIIKDHLQYES